MERVERGRQEGELIIDRGTVDVYIYIMKRHCAIHINIYIHFKHKLSLSKQYETV